MGNNFGAGQSVEEVSRMMLALENFSLEGECLEGNKVFTVVKLTSDGINFLLGKVHIKQKELATYKQDYEKCKKKLLKSKLTHVLISEVVENGKLIILIRQYCDKTLRKKLRTPPFFSWAEKIWVIYQCLLAVSELHRAHVCHGDIKSENFLVTSWNWVFLADIGAFYKPKYLQEGDLTSYKTFFCTGERPACYLAPEKFTVRTKDSELTTQMDVFSLGCVIAEILLDGQYLFTLADLLNFKKTKVFTKLVEIKNSPLKEMLFSMLSHDPAERKPIDFYLEMFQKEILPKDLMEIYRVVKGLTVDHNFSSAFTRILWIGKHLETLEKSENLLILAQCVTSNIRSVLTPDNLVNSLELLTEISEFLSDEAKLHKILPFFLSILQNKSEKPKVKVTCIYSIIQILQSSKISNARDSHLFTEYIWSALSLLINDESEYVKSELAQSLPSIAQIGLNFFKAFQSFSDKSENSDDAFEKFTENFVKIFNQLMVAKPENQIQSDLLRNFAELSKFLDKKSVLNSIFPIIVSWLNKGDRYRSLILSQIPMLLEIMNNPEFTELIFTCIEHGLAHHNELVVYQTLKILEKGNKIDKVLLEKIVKTSLHPSLWIRNTVMQIFKGLIQKIDPIENFSVLRPMIIQFINLPPLSIGLVTEETLENFFSVFKRSMLIKGGESPLLKQTIETFETKDKKTLTVTSIVEEKWKVCEAAYEQPVQFLEIAEKQNLSFEHLEFVGKVQTSFNEHTSAVTNLHIAQSTLVSASSEGVIKIWTLNQLEPFKSIKSQDSFSLPNVSKINTLGSCGQSFFVSHESGIDFLPHLRPVPNSSIHCEKLVKTLPLSNTLLSTIDQQGQLQVFDTRLMQSVQNYSLFLYGPLSNICQGPNPSLLCLSTYTGAIIIYDIRFACPSTILYHSSGLPIFTMQSFNSRSLLVSSEDISLLDLHTNTVSLVLSSSNDSPRIPAFCETLDKDWLMQSCFNIGSRAQKMFETSGIARKLLCLNNSYVVSGGNDFLVKVWDIENPVKSVCLGMGEKDVSVFKEINYGDLRIIQHAHGMAKAKGRYLVNKSICRKEYEEVPGHRRLGHTDAVLDMVVVRQPKDLIVTGSRDGSIKVWN